MQGGPSLEAVGDRAYGLGKYDGGEDGLPMGSILE